MKLKLNEQGNVVVSDGKPVYVADDGKEIVVDHPYTVATIARLNAEAKGHRERAEAAEGKLKAFEGIEDPEKARNAMDTIKNLDDKKLIDAGEVEKVKKEAADAYEERLRATEKKYKPVLDERDSLKSELFQEKVGGAFSRSKFISEKLAIPADLAQARFGQNFSIEEGRIVAKDASGNRIYSRAKPGEVADFDEAFEMLVDAYPHRDSILRGSGASGGGAGGSKTDATGKKTMTRAAFDGLAPAEKSATIKAGTVIAD